MQLAVEDVAQVGESGERSAAPGVPRLARPFALRNDFEGFASSLIAAQTLCPPSKSLMLLEGRTLHELGAFLGALPLLSLSPKCDGHPLLVLPGLVASDVSTRPLRTFLKTRGYAVCGWRLGRNLGLRDGVQDAMVDLVHELNNTHGRTVSLVGWSLGGLYARQLAKMMPERVRQVITLGSPFAAGPKATNAWRVL